MQTKRQLPVFSGTDSDCLSRRLLSVDLRYAVALETFAPSSPLPVKTRKDWVEDGGTNCSNHHKTSTISCRLLAWDEVHSWILDFKKYLHWWKLPSQSDDRVPNQASNHVGLKLPSKILLQSCARNLATARLRRWLHNDICVGHLVCWMHSFYFTCRLWTFWGIKCFCNSTTHLQNMRHSSLYRRGRFIWHLSQSDLNN
jgi:hypothetical protein